MKVDNKNKILLVLLAVAILVNLGCFFGCISAANAQANTPANVPANTPTNVTNEAKVKLESPISIKEPGELITNIVNALLGIIGAVAVLMIIYGGIVYMTAAGNEEKIKMGKTVITGAIIGLVISLLAYVIVNFVIKAIGG
jgi:hypothetical protein